MSSLRYPTPAIPDTYLEPWVVLTQIVAPVLAIAFDDPPGLLSRLVAKLEWYGL